MAKGNSGYNASEASEQWRHVNASRAKKRRAKQKKQSGSGGYQKPDDMPF